MDPTPSDGGNASLIRPFLNRSSAQRPIDHVDNNVGDTADVVRSYTRTGGRSTSSVHLEYESMLSVTKLGTDTLPVLHFERAAIVRLCADEAISVAEISARLKLPIGVIRVLAGDLASEGLLLPSQSTANVADDVALISRLIAGVRAL